MVTRKVSHKELSVIDNFEAPTLVHTIRRLPRQLSEPVVERFSLICRLQGHNDAALKLLDLTRGPRLCTLRGMQSLKVTALNFLKEPAASLRGVELHCEFDVLI